MGGCVLNTLFQIEFFRSNVRKYILTLFFVLSFIFSPSKYAMQVSRGGMDTDMYYLSTELKQFNINGNIASNREYVPVHDAWHKTFRLAYWLDSTYYGQAKLGISDHELESELKKYDIDYYFLWGDGNISPQFLSAFREITENKIPGLKIYSLKAGNTHSSQD